MEISLRNRMLVGVFATVIVVGSGVATALVTSGDAPIGSAADTSTSTGGSVDTTTPSTPDATTPTAPTAPNVRTTRGPRPTARVTRCRLLGSREVWWRRSP